MYSDATLNALLVALIGDFLFLNSFSCTLLHKAFYAAKGYVARTECK